MTVEEQFHARWRELAGACGVPSHYAGFAPSFLVKVHDPLRHVGSALGGPFKIGWK